jgi:hypothetical protein
MFIIVYVGNTGEGKSLEVKKEILQQNKLNIDSWAFDINREYEFLDVVKERCKQDKKGLKSWIHELQPEKIPLCKKTFFNKDILLKELARVRNKHVIIDEATGFFSYRGYNNDLNTLLQLRNHNNHLFIFIYHSLKFVPEYLQVYVKYLKYFRTGDTDKEFKLWRIDKPILKPFESKLYKLL